MKIIFAGSSSFSLPSLEALALKGLVCAVLTAPDRPAGRGLDVQATPVKVFAQEQGIPVLQPESLRADAIAEVLTYTPDVLVCVAYGKIFGPKFLSLFKKGTVNVHPSLLPRFRGAAPIPATILANDTITGVTLQRIAQEMDCGDIILQSKYTISEEDTTSSLLDTLSQQGKELLLQLFENYEELYSVSQVQDPSQAVYCQKIIPALGQVSWLESSKQIELLIRALSRPYSGVKVHYNNKVLKIWSATSVSDALGQEENIGKVLRIQENEGILLQCRRGILLMHELQLAGKKRLSWKEFIKGEPNFIGSILT